jgi:hypothetical protein
MGTKMNLEFQKALQKKKILYFSRGKILIKKELQSAQDDLDESKDRFRNKKYKYATIAAYYSMFHAACALIYWLLCRHYLLTMA